MSKTSSPFKSQKELVSYAQRFVKSRIKVFRKDISICLKADAKRRHAYMPALMTCISFLELFSGLYAGKLKSIGLSGIIDYSNKFMDSNIYTTDRLSILYEAFRHKIAHVTQPYGVFDTHSVKAEHQLRRYPQKFVTWKVNATDRHPPIDIVPEKGTLTINPPWPVSFSHRCILSVYRLKVDITKSVLRRGGYLEELKTDLKAQENFGKCMFEYFPINSIS